MKITKEKNIYVNNLVKTWQNNKYLRKEIEEELLEIYKTMFAKSRNKCCSSYEFLRNDEVFSDQYMVFHDTLELYDFNRGTNLTNYLSRSLRFKIIDLIKKQYKEYEVKSLDQEIAEGNMCKYNITKDYKLMSPLEILIKKESSNRLIDFITYCKNFLNFSNKEINILYLFFFKNKSYKEIAKEIGLSYKGMDSRMSKILICLKTNTKIRKKKK